MLIFQLLNSWIELRKLAHPLAVSRGIDSMDIEVTENKNIHTEEFKNGLQEAIDNVVWYTDNFGNWEDTDDEFSTPLPIPPEPPQRLIDPKSQLNASLSQLTTLKDLYDGMPLPLPHDSFNSIDELTEFVQEWAWSHHYAVIKTGSHLERGIAYLWCDKGGKNRCH